MIPQSQILENLVVKHKICEHLKHRTLCGCMKHSKKYLLNSQQQTIKLITLQLKLKIKRQWHKINLLKNIYKHFHQILLHILKTIKNLRKWLNMDPYLIIMIQKPQQILYKINSLIQKVYKVDSIVHTPLEHPLTLKLRIQNTHLSKVTYMENYIDN